MKPRRLMASVIFVLVLVAGSAALYGTGTRPVLGLDLEGGVSVILSAPEGTDAAVMDRALENIRDRIDAFGTSEPQLFVSGTNIEVQIPGVAGGEVQPRAISRHCIRDDLGIDWGCFEDRATADSTLADAAVVENVIQVCLEGEPLTGAEPCFPTQEDADAAFESLSVGPRPTPSPDPSATPSPALVPGGAPDVESFCLLGDGLRGDLCFATRRAAEAALAQIAVAEPQAEHCLRLGDDTPLAPAGGTGCFGDPETAGSVLDDLAVTSILEEYCVVTGAGVDLGCLEDREEAQARLDATGQDRLLEVLGTTARLEFRQVLNVIDPSFPEYAQTPVTCATEEQRATEACSPDALADVEVSFLDDAGSLYQLGPVRMTGDAIDQATAVYGAGSQQTVATGWQIDFTLSDEGSDLFATVTAELLGQQLAIVVDGVVLSAPTVQAEITGGSGVITGAFEETRAKDLATQLNAGALPVELDTQQVVTVSPTLGSESLRQGLIAAAAGLVALALYLLFYYRLLGVVAFLGMSIWAIFALTLTSLAGSWIGYNLTLAGIAGLVISIGVSADSYIVFFERLKDEIRGGRSARAAVQPAFRDAFRTIIAADVVTALAAVVLYVTAVSSVRGFALTLGVATMLDLFVVYFFKRPLVFLIARNQRLVDLRGFGLSSAAAATTTADRAATAGVTE